MQFKHCEGGMGINEDGLPCNYSTVRGGWVLMSMVYRAIEAL